MTLEEVLRYTKSALQDACYDQYWIKEIPKFIQNQADENRRLRYERLMWKANFFREVKVTELHTRHPNKSWHKLAIQTERIAEALEERAMKIKEEM